MLLNLKARFGLVDTTPVANTTPPPVTREEISRLFSAELGYGRRDTARP